MSLYIKLRTAIKQNQWLYAGYKIVSKMCIRDRDLPICIDACGNDMYIHVMVREGQLDIANRIKQDVLDGFSK